MMILPMLRRSLVAAVTLAIAGTAAAQNYDSLTNIKAAQFAPATLLKGPFHTVDENITVAGAQPNFTIRSQYRRLGSARPRNAQHSRLGAPCIRATCQSQQVG